MALPTWLQGLWVPSGLQRGVSAVLLMIICNFLLFKFSVLGRAWHSCRVYVGSSGCCCLGCCRAAATAGVAEAQVVLVLSSWSPAWGPAFGHWARNYQNYFEHTARNGLCHCQQPLHVRWTNMRKARSEGSEGETWIPETSGVQQPLLIPHSGCLFPFVVSSESLAPVLPVPVSPLVVHAGLGSVTLKLNRKLWEEGAPEGLWPGSLSTAAGTECLNSMKACQKWRDCDPESLPKLSLAPWTLSCFLKAKGMLLVF